MQSNSNLHTETFDIMLNNAKKMYDKIISTNTAEEICLLSEELKILYGELINSEFLLHCSNITNIVEQYMNICSVAKKLCILSVNNIDEYTKYFMTYIKYNQQLLDLDDYMRDEITFNKIMSLSDELGSLENVYNIDVPIENTNNVDKLLEDTIKDLDLDNILWYANINDEDTENLAKYTMENNKIEPVNLKMDITKDKEKLENYNFVDHPSHYNTYDIEVIEMMRRIWGDEKVADWCEITAFKYRMRVGSKPDNPIKQDLEKEQWYIAKAKELRNKK